ncbi:MAG: ATP-dependent DNA helicase RecG [Saprospiraceae bacterium]|uniref:ATP-dependent DNA helicase RecG n=1 Tax=Candidatus Opimibacter skivensis TaxID=2982028 RepID=A0A9D7XM00_9BACT|nr:ATP-dependent DNA helicase RecG [Candidatus Opimibacter skivensis]
MDQPIEYLKGVGPARGEALRKELSIHRIGDLLWDLPFRYIDKSQITSIAQAKSLQDTVQLKGIFTEKLIEGTGHKKRLVGTFEDSSGEIEIIWFQRYKEIDQWVKTGKPYLLYGKVQDFRGKFNIVHPEIEEITEDKTLSSGLEPVYSSTEKLMLKGLDSKGRRKIIKQLFSQLRPHDIKENLSAVIISKLRFKNRFETFKDVHLPANNNDLQHARNRIKFEELFFLQLLLLRAKVKRNDTVRGFVFGEVGNLFNTFFSEKLPFRLTEAQKRVMREIRKDMGSGKQMNRLLQGDVGSGKTVVALMCMLLAADNGYQSVLMAPTEVLAMQHYKSISTYLEGMDMQVAFLSGSVTGNARVQLLESLRTGKIHILLGTHAVIEEGVEFKNLGLAITDEQHRFGVAQRAQMWTKSPIHPPHVLVMTATPIPRTLALTIYGDLDISILDELPPGRKPIVTTQRTEAHRSRVMEFVRAEIAKGRQVYIIYPLIEESEKLDLENLMDGYERLLGIFPRPDYQISVVHGRMKADVKDAEMRRFVEKKTQIMVSTTVIEVGVDVPNASVMIIENAERFGLAQLHQLRGRVGRGAEQSYCILMTSYKLSKAAKERLDVICKSNDGFFIAEADLKQRGPGDIAGTRQSGAYEFKAANLVEDQAILRTARAIAEEIITNDPELKSQEHIPLARYLMSEQRYKQDWSRIS